MMVKIQNKFLHLLKNSESLLDKIDARKINNWKQNEDQVDDVTVIQINI